ncbi:MAG: hypothetical protein MK052_08170 [Alphaproteobacteria bacterium]|nr:hypothetical protein [Alphaproteobacteria bacterium]
MANITFNTGLNLNTQTNFYDFLSDDLVSVTTTRVVYNLPFGGSQIYTGFFDVDFRGNISPNSQITAIDTLGANNTATISITGLQLPVSTYENFVNSNTITGANNVAQLREFILSGDDNVTGSNGNDSAILFTGNDIFIGFDGNDFVNGHFGNDTLNGHSGNDTVRGGADNDIVRGGAGDDVILGDKGNDTILGDKGDDTLFGGEGADTFIFKRDSGSDVIVDFDASDRLIIYSRAGLTNINDFDISVSDGNSVIDMRFGEDITLLNYDSLTTADITLVA